MTAVARSAVLVATLTVLGACGDDDAVTTAAGAASTFPTVTLTMAPTLDDVSPWEPADEIPLDLETSLTALLRSRSAWMLLPSPAPIEEPTAAEIAALTPGNDPTAVTYNLVVLQTGSLAVVLSLSNSPADLDPCSSLFPEYASIEIRSTEGCAKMVDGGVDFLNWVEDGR